MVPFRHEYRNRTDCMSCMKYNMPNRRVEVKKKEEKTRPEYIYEYTYTCTYGRATAVICMCNT